MGLPVEESGWLAVRCRGEVATAEPARAAARVRAYVRRRGAPGGVAGLGNARAAVQRLLDELDAMLRWAKEKARCETPRDRERLCHVFEEARTILAKKLSP